MDTHKASRILSFPLPTKMLRPDRCELHDDHLVIRKWRLLGLASSREEIDYQRVSTVRVSKRLIAATVMVETYGGATGDLTVPRLTRRSADALSRAVRTRMQPTNA